MGCGLSDKPQAYSYTLSQHINNLEALLDTLKLERLTLFLHDWGGPIGMGYALRHPERAKRFVVFNTAAFPASRIPFRINVCKLPGFGALAVRGLNAFAGLAPTMACAKRERMTPAVKAGYLAPYDSYANRVAILRFVQDIPLRPSHPTYRLVEEIGRGLVLFKDRSEEHTSELQSRLHLVCRLLLEKKKISLDTRRRLDIYDRLQAFRGGVILPRPRL